VSYDPGGFNPASQASAFESKPGAFKNEPPLEYMRAFNFLFDHPSWMTILLMAGVCVLIPLIGQIVLIGYQFVLIEALLRGDGRTFPEFDFGQFTNYLMRGLWPWLAQLIGQFVAAIPIYILFFGGMMCFMGVISAAGDEAVAGVGMLVMMVFMFVGAFAACALMMLIITPMTIRAGLSQELGEAFKFGWVKDFIGRTWKEMLIFALVMMAGSVVLMMIGYAVFCVGALAAFAVIMMANAHMYYQLYELYLARGGEPVPMKEPAVV
jgi:hypothetical protein